MDEYRKYVRSTAVALWDNPSHEYLPTMIHQQAKTFPRGREGQDSAEYYCLTIQHPKLLCWTCSPLCAESVMNVPNQARVPATRACCAKPAQTGTWTGDVSDTTGANIPTG